MWATPLDVQTSGMRAKQQAAAFANCTVLRTPRERFLFECRGLTPICYIVPQPGDEDNRVLLPHCCTAAPPHRPRALGGHEPISFNSNTMTQAACKEPGRHARAAGRQRRAFRLGVSIRLPRADCDHRPARRAAGLPASGSGSKAPASFHDRRRVIRPSTRLAGRR